MALLGYVAAVFMGVTLGLLGGGGSILTVPILVYLFGVNPIEATTSSLFIVGVTAAVSSFQYVKRRQIDFKAGLQFALASFVGIFFSRNIVLPWLPETIFTYGEFQLTSDNLVLISFAILMIVASTAMISGKKSAEIDPSRRSLIKTGLQGIAVGAVTGFVGAGGGFLILPALVRLVGLQMRIAVGTSLAIIAANSLFGFSLSYFRSVQVDWVLQLSVLALAIGGSIIGAQFSNRISERTLKKVFGIFVLVMGSLIIIERFIFMR